MDRAAPQAAPQATAHSRRAPKGSSRPAAAATPLLAPAIAGPASVAPPATADSGDAHAHPRTQGAVQLQAIQAKIEGIFGSRVVDDLASDGPVQLSRWSAQPGSARAAADSGAEQTTARVHQIARLGVSGPGHPLPFLDTIQRSFGRHDVSKVQAHTDGSAAAGNRSLGATAFAVGSHIAFAGTPDLRTAAHEAAHTVQQRGGVQLSGGVGRAGDRYEQHADAVADRVVRGESSEALLDSMAGGSPAVAVQMNYAALSPMSKARVDQQSDEKYAEKAQAFEVGMAPLIMADARVNRVVDKLLGRVRRIVDAWAESTGRAEDATYEREFAWQGGDEYYGAFAMTAANIRQIFDDPTQPMRSKLKIVYNAVRNNNLSKWLKLAAIELRRAHMGKKARDWKIKTATQNVTTVDPVTRQQRIVAGRAEKETVKSGFAHRSGLRYWMNTGAALGIAHTADQEQLTEHARSQRDVFGHDRYSQVMGWHQDTVAANSQRRSNANYGLTLPEQRTLTVREVPDLTDAEVDLLLKRQGNNAPTANDRAIFRANPNTRIPWSQGGEFYDVQLGSASARAAFDIRARMEAGISGSTDLMLHATRHLGMGDQTHMKGMRLALAGWMMANRDHSFYEVYKAATSYGLRFETDRNNPGSEYESAANLTPMGRDDFQNVLPERVFPRHFLSGAYKDVLANALPNANQDQAALSAALVAQGIPGASLNALDARAIAAVSRLAQVVAAAPIDPTRRMALKLQDVRRIRQHDSFVYLGNQRGEAEATALLSALLQTHHRSKGLLPDQNNKSATLADAGVPRSLLDQLSPQGIDYFDAIRTAIMLGREVPAQAEAALVNALTADAYQRAKMVLYQNYLGNAALNPEGTALANDARKSALMVHQIERIARSRPTSGWWFTWGDVDYLEYQRTTPSIRQATVGVPSAQGPGMYVAKTTHSSASYGNKRGQRVLAVYLNNTPTIDKWDNGQKQAVRGLYAPDPIPIDYLDALYQRIHVVPMLLTYGAGPGFFSRLTTNEGVQERTFDLSRPPLADLRNWYGRIGDATAMLNFKTQAIQWGLRAQDFP